MTTDTNRNVSLTCLSVTDIRHSLWRIDTEHPPLHQHLPPPPRHHRHVGGARACRVHRDQRGDLPPGHPAHDRGHSGGHLCVSHF